MGRCGIPVKKLVLLNRANELLKRKDQTFLEDSLGKSRAGENRSSGTSGMFFLALQDWHEKGHFGLPGVQVLRILLLLSNAKY